VQVHWGTGTVPASVVAQTLPETWQHRKGQVRGCGRRADVPTASRMLATGVCSGSHVGRALAGSWPSLGPHAIPLPHPWRERGGSGTWRMASAGGKFSNLAWRDGMVQRLWRTVPVLPLRYTQHHLKTSKQTGCIMGVTPHRVPGVLSRICTEDH
jgi:hypothetical protein